MGKASTPAGLSKRRADGGAAEPLGGGGVTKPSPGKKRSGGAGPKTASPGPSQASGASLADDDGVREGLRRLVAEHAGDGDLQPQSSQLWSLASAAVTEFLGWLPAEDRKKVKIMLPRLAAGGAGAAVSQVQFHACFMGLYAKLRLKREADELLDGARESEARGDAPGAEEAYRGCLEIAPRNAQAHLGLALLLRSTARPCTDEIAGHLRAAHGFAAAPEVAEEAASKLALLLCQEADDEAAAAEEVQALLLPMGLRYRLADCILRYTRPPAGSAAAPVAEDGQRGLIAVLDDALPLQALRHLQDAFGPESPFWLEHNYSSYPPSPYFSYLHPLPSGPAFKPASSLDQVIKFVQAEVAKHFPAVKDARCAEWWAHCRPHTHGHQLHFDSDNEGEDGVRNPIASTIIYLSEGAGGPTLMTTQHVKDAALAARGWLAFPRLNRLVAFDAEYLHGVIPGRGADQALPGSRRVSLMIAFWKHELKERPREDGRPGACIPRPDLSGAAASDGTPTKPSAWAQMLRLLPEPLAPTSPARIGAQPIDAIWQDVDADLAEADGTAVKDLDSLPSYDLCFQGF